MNQIEKRLKRIHAAMDKTVSTDFSQIKHETTRIDANTVQYSIDFRKGKSEEELWNDAYLVIANIANLRDPLRAWLCKTRKDKKDFDNRIQTCKHIMAVIYLNNNEKHGFHKHKRKRAKKSIMLKSVTQSLVTRAKGTALHLYRLKVGQSKAAVIQEGITVKEMPSLASISSPNSLPPLEELSAGLPDGPAVVTSGKTELIVRGEIVDAEGKHYDDLHHCLECAIAEYERILSDYGVALSDLHETETEEFID